MNEKLLNNFYLLGTRNYIDSTKDLNTMRKRLRFQLPNPPLKVLRGEEDVEDIQDKIFAAFAPPPTTDDTTDHKSDVTDDSLPDYVTTDIGDVSDEGMARFLGGSNLGSIDDFNRDSRSSLTVSEKSSIREEGSDSDSDTQNVNQENIEMKVLAQVHVEREETDEISV